MVSLHEKKEKHSDNIIKETGKHSDNIIKKTGKTEKSKIQAINQEHTERFTKTFSQRSGLPSGIREVRPQKDIENNPNLSLVNAVTAIVFTCNPSLLFQENF